MNPKKQPDPKNDQQPDEPGGEAPPPEEPPAGDQPPPEDEGAGDEPGGDADDEAKRRPPPLSEVLKDPRYAAQHGKMLAAERKRVEAELRRRLEAEAKEKTRRDNLAEVDRLKAELKDAEDARRRVEDELRGAAVDRDINRALVDGDIRLQDGALDILRDKVLAAVKDEEAPDYPAAVDATLKKFPWMRLPKEDKGRRQAPTEGAEEPAKGRQIGEERPAGSRKGTTTPAPPAPKKPVDAMNMSPQEYAKHRREKGLN